MVDLAINLDMNFKIDCKCNLKNPPDEKLSVRLFEMDVKFSKLVKLHKFLNVMKNILVGIDFHEQSRKLISKSVEFAKLINGKLWLLHVAAPDPDFVGFKTGPQFIRDDRAEVLKEERRKLWNFTQEIEQQGIDADGLLIQGATIETILEETVKLDIDLIIAGYHEHNFLYDAFFGNTSVQIIKKSSIPVLVFPLN